MIDPQQTVVRLSFNSNPMSARALAPHLGPLLNLFATSIMEPKIVYLTRLTTAVDHECGVHRLNPNSSINLKATLRDNDIETLGLRWDLKKADEIEAFQDRGIPVICVQTSAYAAEVRFSSFKQVFQFPLPIRMTDHRVQLARSSRYINVSYLLT